MVLLSGVLGVLLLLFLLPTRYSRNASLVSNSSSNADKLDRIDFNGAVIATKDDENNFNIVEFAGDPNLTYRYKNHVKSLKMRAFTSDPEVEGVLIFGKEFDYSRPHSIATITTTPIYNGMCLIRFEGQTFEINPHDFIEYLNKKNDKSSPKN